MANAEHLEILKSGVENWNEWRRENRIESLAQGEVDFKISMEDLLDPVGAADRLMRNGVSKLYRIQADLSGADLKRCDLKGADLIGVNLSGANLFMVDLSGAYLTGANLKGATLSRTELSGAFLSGAELSGANLCRAELSGVDLRGVNLSETDLTHANLYDNFLSHGRLSGAKLSGSKLPINLTETNLSGADLSETELMGVNLQGANLAGANLLRADLTNANLTYSNIENTDFSYCKLATTIFGLTDLSTCKGLETVQVSGPCIIDFHTLKASKNLPETFLTKLGIPNLLMQYLPDFYDPALRIYPAFLSHSWADKAFVRKLYEALTKKGVTTWLDEKKMKPGDNIHDSIGDAIKYYDKLILVCSKNALNSWWVEKELERVYEKERELQKERGKKFRLVIPIRIDDSILGWKDGVAATMKSSMIGDFTKWQDEAEFEKAVKELVDALNAGRVDIKPPSFL